MSRETPKFLKKFRGVGGGYVAKMGGLLMSISGFSSASKWIESGQYQKDIDDMCTSIIKAARSSQNEAQTADAFEKNLYYTIKLRTGIEVDFQKETKIKSIEHHLFGALSNRKSGKGRLDGLVNNLVIEYKHNSQLTRKRDFNKAVEQVEDYLKALFEEKGDRFNAISQLCHPKPQQTQVNSAFGACFWLILM